MAVAGAQGYFESLFTPQREASRPGRIRIRGCRRRGGGCVAYVDEADWVRPFRTGSFDVTSVEDDRAEADLVETTEGHNRIHFGLVKLGGRWVIDTSSAILPQGR